MFAHICLGSNDLARSAQFYDAGDADGNKLAVVCRGLTARQEKTR